MKDMLWVASAIAIGMLAALALHSAGQRVERAIRNKLDDRANAEYEREWEARRAAEADRAVAKAVANG